MNDCTFIILGASGDLTRRKLIPALYDLAAKKHLTQFVVIGAARDQLGADEMLARAQPFIHNFDPAVWEQFSAHFFYQQLDFGQLSDYEQLNTLAIGLEKDFGLSGNRMIYCAASADFFCTITQNIASSRLAERLDTAAKIWHRIVYEKPFGHDLESARHINECIAQSFYENQVYRIDHYLTKELVGNITLVRFTNCIFEPLWNNRYIDHIQIVVSEEDRIEGRGAYYDNYGALSDVVQNHMLELVALIAMEPPWRLTGEYVRSERAAVLERVRPVDGVLGQYEQYSQEKAVKQNSSTETFAALFLMVDNPRWSGVPFYLKTGKALNKKETVIHIKFKQVDCLLMKHCPTESNYLTIRVNPDPSFALSLNAKRPGVANELVPITMDFCHSCLFGTETPQAHEVLLEEIMRGEQSVSVRFDEIESSWRVIDKLRLIGLPLYEYRQGSNGPEEVKTEFEQKHGMKWRS